MIDRKLCKPGFGYFRSWRCPVCAQGTLEKDNDMVRHGAEAGVEHAISEGHIERSDDRGVFSATLTCSNSACRQSVATMGEYSAYELDEPYQYEQRYSFRAFHPPLKLIDVSEATPAPIAEALERSFALFWSDYAACASVIRVAIEALAKHLESPGPPAKKFMTLVKRLDKLNATHPEIVEAAQVIKNVGNGGAHGDTVEQDKLLACYELLEIELRTLFNDDNVRRRALIDGLKNRG